MAVPAEKALVKVSAKVLGFVCNSTVTNYVLIAIPSPGNAGQVFHLTPPCHFDLQACWIVLALGIETGRDFQCK